MKTKQDLIDTILPVIKKELIGSAHPVYNTRIISDVRISFKEQSYYDTSSEYPLFYNEFEIKVETTTKDGKNPGWIFLPLE